MVFETDRKIEDNIFSTTIIRIADENEDAARKEAKLENDFGPVEVEIGGLFKGFIYIDTDNKPVYRMTMDADEISSKGAVELKFVEDSKKIALVPKSTITFNCNSKKETSRKDNNKKEFSAIQIAELKSHIFEETMKARIIKAVEDWKANQSDFESGSPDIFEIKLD